jgi:hypothetical protein
MDLFEQQQVEKVVRLLRLLNAEYKIILPCGDDFGTLEVVPAKQPKSHAVARSARLYYWPLIETMVPGERRVIDAGDFDLAKFAGNMQAFCIHRWGTGCVTYTTDRTANTVTIGRLA